MSDESEDVIGALWSKRTKHDKEYLTGAVNGQRVVCFRNTQSSNPNAPTWKVLKSRPAPDAPGITAGAAGNRPWTRPTMNPRRMPPSSAARRGLLTIEDAAAYLGLSPGTLRNWVSTRRIDYVKVGRLTRISLAVLDRYIDQQTIRAVEGADR